MRFHSLGCRFLEFCAPSEKFVLCCSRRRFRRSGNGELRRTWTCDEFLKGRAIEAAFSSAVRITLVGSMTPAFTRSSYYAIFVFITKVNAGLPLTTEAAKPGSSDSAKKMYLFPKMPRFAVSARVGRHLNRECELNCSAIAPQQLETDSGEESGYHLSP